MNAQPKSKGGFFHENGLSLVWLGLFFVTFMIGQTVFGQLIPYQVFLTIPYVLSILALAVMSRHAKVPQALMVPFRKGER